MNRQHKQMLQTLGANIREARIRAGLTLPTLSKLSGVSRGNVSKAEHGGNITAVTLYRLCWSIGIHPIGVLPAFHTRPILKQTKAVAAMPTKKAEPRAS